MPKQDFRFCQLTSHDGEVLTIDSGWWKGQDIWQDWFCNHQSLDKMKHDLELNIVRKHCPSSLSWPVARSRLKALKQEVDKCRIVGRVNTGVDNGYGHIFMNMCTGHIHAMNGGDETHFAMHVADSLDDIVNMWQRHCEAKSLLPEYRDDYSNFVDNLVFDGRCEGCAAQNLWRTAHPRAVTSHNTSDIVYGDMPMSKF